MRAVAMTAMALLLAGCGTQGGGPESAAHQDRSPGLPLRVATAQRYPATNTAGLTGVLHGRVNADGTACFWISVDGKPESRPVAIRWPASAVAYDDPLRVVNAEGHEFGRVGGPVDLVGGFIDPDQLPLLGCTGFTVAFG